MKLFDQGPEILDVTLRDGSYLIDFQFTEEDTSKIAAGLEAVGIRWIEIGHGLGLNASAAGKGEAAASDEAYLAAAQKSMQTARWGMFCIPGIARLEDLDLASRYGMSLVRVGTNITEIDVGRPYIERAKELGMIVSYNAMKSYAVSPEEFGIRAAKVGRWGADIICLVDSAGGMFPEDVTAYLGAAKNETEAYLGYHGHNNLTLSMANTLQAVECGAMLVDASLQGMGRSAGNTATEPLAAILKRRGYLKAVDVHALMDVGQGLVAPLMRGHGLDPMAVTSGYALFHSSFSAKVKGYADKYGLDVRDVIVQLTQEDLVDAPDELLERIGKDLAAAKIPRVISIPAFSGAGDKADDPVDRLDMLIRKLRPEALKNKKFSVLNVVMGEAPMARMIVSGNIQHTPAHVVGSVTLTNEDDFEAVLKSVDGKIDVVFLDVDRKDFAVAQPSKKAVQWLKKTRILTYFDSRVWVNAVEDQVVRQSVEALDDQSVVIVGDHPKSRFLALRLQERNATVTLVGEEPVPYEPVSRVLAALSLSAKLAPLTVVNQNTKQDIERRISTADIIVAWAKPWFLPTRLFAALKDDAVVIDAAMGALDSESIETIQLKTEKLYRLNMWPALSGALEAAHESDRVRREDMGRSVLGRVPVVAGGTVGKSGEVVVDSIRHPSRVIGVADGFGGLRFNYSAAEEEQIKNVKEAIYQIQLAPRV